MQPSPFPSPSSFPKENGMSPKTPGGGGEGKILKIESVRKSPEMVLADNRIEQLNETIFNLKLKVFHLQERVFDQQPKEMKGVVEENIQLKTDLQTKSKECHNRSLLLVKVRNALENLQLEKELTETEFNSRIQGLRRRVEDERVERERAQNLLEKADSQLKRITEDFDSSKSKIQNLENTFEKSATEVLKMRKVLQDSDQKIQQCEKERDATKLALSSARDQWEADADLFRNEIQSRGKLVEEKERDLLARDAEAKRLSAQLEEMKTSNEQKILNLTLELEKTKQELKSARESKKKPRTPRVEESSGKFEEGSGKFEENAGKLEGFGRFGSFASPRSVRRKKPRFSVREDANEKFNMNESLSRSIQSAPVQRQGKESKWGLTRILVHEEALLKSERQKQKNLQEALRRSEAHRRAAERTISELFSKKSPAKRRLGGVGEGGLLDLNSTATSPPASPPILDIGRNAPLSHTFSSPRFRNNPFDAKTSISSTSAPPSTHVYKKLENEKTELIRLLRISEKDRVKVRRIARALSLRSKSQLNELSSTSSSHRESAERKLERAKSRVRELESEIRTLRRALEMAEMNAKTSEAKMEREKAEKETLQREMKDLQKRHNAEKETLQREMKDLQERHSAALEVEKSISNLRGKFAEVSRQLAESQRRFSEVSRECADAQRKFSESSKDLLQAQNDLVEARGKFSELSGELSKKSAEFLEVSGELSGVRRQLVKSEGKVLEYSGELNQAREAITQISQKLLKLSTDFEKTQKSETKAQKDLKQAQEALEMAQKSEKKTQNDLKETREALKMAQKSEEKTQNELKETREALKMAQKSEEKSQNDLKQTREALKMAKNSEKKGENDLKRTREALNMSRKDVKNAQETLTKNLRREEEISRELSDMREREAKLLEEVQKSSEALEVAIMEKEKLRVEVKDIENKLKEEKRIVDERTVDVTPRWMPFLLDVFHAFQDHPISTEHSEKLKKSSKNLGDFDPDDRLVILFKRATENPSLAPSPELRARIAVWLRGRLEAIRCLRSALEATVREVEERIKRQYLELNVQVETLWSSLNRASSALASRNTYISRKERKIIQKNINAADVGGTSVGQLEGGQFELAKQDELNRAVRLSKLNEGLLDQIMILEETLAKERKVRLEMKDELDEKTGALNLAVERVLRVSRKARVLEGEDDATRNTQQELRKLAEDFGPRPTDFGVYYNDIDDPFEPVGVPMCMQESR